MPSLLRGPAQASSKTNAVKVSSSWAGYAVISASKGNAFQNVTGSWVQPAVTCPSNQNPESAFWVGIDGYQKSAKTIEQVGTDSDCSNPGGPNYYGWWELYPGNLNGISQSTYPISSGDSMTATVSRSGTVYTLTLVDNSAGWTFSTTQTFKSKKTKAKNASAEWVVEVPDGALADFGSVTFSGCSADGQPISSSSFKSYELQLGKSPEKAAPSALTGGNSFTVTWKHA
jgi:hypothetical protein